MSGRVPLPLPEWAYLFDVDGTLAPIAATPDDAKVDARTRSLMALLYDATEGAVALVSGRSLDDLARVFPDLRIPAAGQHGAEWRDAAGTVHRAAVPPESFEAMRTGMKSIQESHPGLMLEDKGLSLALHYRAAPERGTWARRAVEHLHASVGAGMSIQRGKAVIEAIPAGTDKGDAVTAFMAIPPFKGRRPVFVGDDASDEHAFEIVNELHGVSVRVGRGNTVAHWRLADVAAVRSWLERGAMRRPDR